MDKVFVTGANGLLGTNLVLLLLEQGFDVVALVRRIDSFIQPDYENLELVQGSLGDAELIREKIKKCRYVVHIAANTSQELLNLNDYYPANVKGTQSVIDACLNNNVDKLVYVGTANTFGYGSLLRPGNENAPMRYPFTKSLYALSKKKAQEIVDSAAGSFNITTISPTFMLGSYDTKPSSGRIIQRALGKRVVFYPPGGKSFIHVKDVALSIVKAFDREESGETFILSNENLSYREFYEKVLRLNRQKALLVPVPRILLRAVGIAGDLLRILRVRTEISSVNTSALAIKNYYCNNKAKQYLCIDFTPIDKAITDTLRYFGGYKT